MKYLKLFKTNVDYQNYIESDDCIKPNVSYAQDTDNLYYNPPVDKGPIILTHESNPAVMDICYYQGWAASPDVMYKSEAEKVTDIGTAFQGLQGNTHTYGYGTYGYGSNDLTEEFTSFDEFKYFTGVTSISDSAFKDCSRLTSILIPDSVTSIGLRAFEGCSELTSILIPNSVTSIASVAFGSCTGLTSVILGDSVTSMGTVIFDGCSALTSIKCLAPTAPTISYSTFIEVKSNGVLYYPSGSDYSSWMKNDYCYLGYYNWTSQEISQEI